MTQNHGVEKGEEHGVNTQRWRKRKTKKDNKCSGYFKCHVKDNNVNLIGQK